MNCLIRQTYRLLLVLSLLPLLSGCNNEDDVAAIFTGKTWKLSRLTDKGNGAPFYSGIWNNNRDMEESLNKLNHETSYFTLEFEGEELDGELMGAKVSGKGVGATISGTWDADGKSKALTFNLKVSGTENDALGKAFIKGLQNVYKYEGDIHSLTLYFKDGGATRVIGLTPNK
ncbi:DUF4847 family protein [Bacteroides sp.]|uniref:DUF4847 family protein n=1 Tax=Bacteroides sp. TaxID=29523 RepID=UPI0023BE9955|nr:DUF4847 family protein [Bacteroides sp.]MDE6216904.1 DUF4847 domain-containing protein [Bacteroides sp.]